MKQDRLISKHVSNPGDYFDIITDGNLNVSDVNVIHPDLLQVMYRYKSHNVPLHGFISCTTAAMVTSYSRIRLLRVMRMIENPPLYRMIYANTDSVVFIHPRGNTPVSTGTALGELSDEIFATFGVVDTIATWVCTGGKSYGMRLREHPEMSKMKVKGFALNLAASELVNMRQMVDMVTVDQTLVIDVPYKHQIRRDKNTMTLRVVDIVKKFAFTAQKRVVCGDSYFTLPYGHVNIGTASSHEPTTSHTEQTVSAALTWPIPKGEDREGKVDMDGPDDPKAKVPRKQ